MELVYKNNMSKNSAAKKCKIPPSTAKKKLADFEKAQISRNMSLKMKK